MGAATLSRRATTGIRRRSTGTSLSVAVALALCSAGRASAAPGDTVWVGEAVDGIHRAVAIEVDPAGSRVFVAGTSSMLDWEIAALEAGSGEVLWHDTIGEPDLDEYAADLAVAPDGSRVYALGFRRAEGTGYWHYETVAFDPETGDHLWERTYEGPAGLWDTACCMAVSPDGSRVFVTGTSDTQEGTVSATVAYSATDGTRLWSRRFSLQRERESATAIAASPDGSTVVVAGTTLVTGPLGVTDKDIVTVGLSADDGSVLWSSRFAGTAERDDRPWDVVIGPASRRVVVVGTSRGAETFSDVRALAYTASTGVLMWTTGYDGPGRSWDLGRVAVVSGDGRTVIVTGYGGEGPAARDFLTLGLEAGSGRLSWTRRFEGPVVGQDRALAVAPADEGATAVVTGWATTEGAFRGADFQTVAYSTAGKQMWSATFDSTLDLDVDQACCVVASDGAVTAFVLGRAGLTDWTLTVVAYEIAGAA
jgi:DNA-binding beta-propeller fold protein YncE